MTTITLRKFFLFLDTNNLTIFMKNILFIGLLFLFQISFAQEETKKDSILPTELKEVVVQSKKKSIEQKAD